ncbi:MAG: hypothetical protein LBM93_03100 [Oscillospiraceae bacterium]|nr:hypothetical protein [Oscillospiraceae bacterium]
MIPLKLIQGILFVLRFPLALAGGILKILSGFCSLSIILMFIYNIAEHIPIDWAVFITLFAVNALLVIAAYLPEQLYELSAAASEGLWDLVTY